MDGEQIERRRDLFLPVSILVAAVLISGSIVYVVGKKSASDSAASRQVASISNVLELLAVSPSDVILGDPKAPVTIVEYGDYQCPGCGRFSLEVESAIRDTYVKAGKVKIVFRDFIVNDRTELQHESQWSAEAAACAKDQGQFWAYHDALFRAEVQDGQENNGNLNRDLFIKIAEQLEMDRDMFAACFDSHKHSSDVISEMNNGRLLGIDATPTAFVNGVQIRGVMQNDPRFQAAIENALKSK